MEAQARSAATLPTPTRGALSSPEGCPGRRILTLRSRRASRSGTGAAWRLVAGCGSGRGERSEWTPAVPPVPRSAVADWLDLGLPSEVILLRGEAARDVPGVADAAARLAPWLCQRVAPKPRRHKTALNGRTTVL